MFISAIFDLKLYPNTIVNIHITLHYISIDHVIGFNYKASQKLNEPTPHGLTSYT